MLIEIYPFHYTFSEIDSFKLYTFKIMSFYVKQADTVRKSLFDLATDTVCSLMNHRLVRDSITTKLLDPSCPLPQVLSLIYIQAKE